MKRMLMRASWCVWLSTAWVMPGCGDGADRLVDAATDGSADTGASDGSIDFGGDGGTSNDLGTPDGFVGVAPSALADGYAASSGFTLSVDASTGVLANDTLGDPVGTVVSFGGGSLGGTAADRVAGATAAIGTGSLVLRADGSFDFTPDTGFLGSFTVDYVLANAEGSASATVTIEVSAGPTAVDDTYAALADTTFQVLGGTADALLANDLGAPAPSVVSFGGGDLGGSVDDHSAGATASFGTTGSLTVTADGGVELVPEAGFSGQFTFDYEIMNALGSSTGTVTITVQAAPTLAGTPPNGEVGVSYAFNFTVSGFPTPTLNVTAGALPPGLALSGNSITGTPTMPGNFSGITVTAGNGVGAPATLDFAITVNSPPAITSAASTTFVVGVAGSFTVTATGTPAPTIARTGALPTGVTFAGGVLSGTPAAGTGGTYPVTFTASNGVGSNAVQSFTLTVNQAPSVSGAPPSGALGTSYNHAFTVAGFPAPTLSLTAGTLPPGLALVGNSITGTPTMPGTFSGLTVTASNGVGSPATLTFSITVNSPPAITSAASTTFVVGAAGSFTVTATGTPAPTIARTGALPTGVTFAGGVLSGTPAAGTGGTYPLTFTATNGVGSNAVQSFTLTVNQAPTVSGAPPSGTVSTSYNHTFTVAGFPAPTLSLTAGTLPPG
ncbi:MAG: hypothetical protein KC668_22360, partial [Myxococcales bacterium]|nr:hypothetical protein [Myxococcales bacterium]